MANRGNVRIGLIMMGTLIVIQMLAGIMAGYRQDWMRMGIFLSGSILIFISFTSSLLVLKIDTCFKHLEDLISNNVNISKGNS